jgi:hypothetical protein
VRTDARSWRRKLDMKRRISGLATRGTRLAASALTSLLVAYLFFGTCGGSKSGFVLAFRAGKIVVTAGWCGPFGSKDQS